jgi:hypothetical protein
MLWSAVVAVIYGEAVLAADASNVPPINIAAATVLADISVLAPMRNQRSATLARTIAAAAMKSIALRV